MKRKCAGLTVPRIIYGLALCFLFVCCEKNTELQILGITYTPASGSGGSVFTLSAEVLDEDGDSLTYQWTSAEGRFISDVKTSQIKWEAPITESNKTFQIFLDVTDKSNTSSKSIDIAVDKTLFGYIYVYVYHTGCKIGIPDATIEIINSSAVTNSSGYSYLKNVPLGNISIKTTKEDFDDAITEVQVRSSGRVELSMTSQIYTTTITGTIRDEETARLRSGLEITMLNPDGTDSDLKSTTDINGFFRIRRIPTGLRTLTIKFTGVIVHEERIELTNTEYQMDVDLPAIEIFTDPRDQNMYTYKVIGNQTWMLDNLNYLPSISPIGWSWLSGKFYYVYGYEGTNVETARNTGKGVLYNWSAAQTACPEGWHLPSDDEWKTLESYLSMLPEEIDILGWRNAENVGDKMKSAFGWQEDGNGTNCSSFNVLPEGANTFRLSPGGAPYAGESWGMGNNAYFWTSTGSHLGYFRNLEFKHSGVNRNVDRKSSGYSVRCVKD